MGFPAVEEANRRAAAVTALVSTWGFVGASRRSIRDQAERGPSHSGPPASVTSRPAG
jgi:hypothetical protein